MPLLSPLFGLILLPILILILGGVIAVIGAILYGVFLILKAFVLGIIRIKVSKSAGFWLTTCFLIAGFVLFGFVFGLMHR